MPKVAMVFPSVVVLKVLPDQLSSSYPSPSSKAARTWFLSKLVISCSEVLKSGSHSVVVIGTKLTTTMTNPFGTVGQGSLKAKKDKSGFEVSTKERRHKSV